MLRTKDPFACVAAMIVVGTMASAFGAPVGSCATSLPPVSMDNPMIQYYEEQARQHAMRNPHHQTAQALWANWAEALRRLQAFNAKRAAAATQQRGHPTLAPTRLRGSHKESTWCPRSSLVPQRHRRPPCQRPSYRRPALSWGTSYANSSLCPSLSPLNQ